MDIIKTLGSYRMLRRLQKILIKMCDVHGKEHCFFKLHEISILIMVLESFPYMCVNGWITKCTMKCFGVLRTRKIVIYLQAIRKLNIYMSIILKTIAYFYAYLTYYWTFIILNPQGDYLKKNVLSCMQTLKTFRLIYIFH